MGAGWEVGVEVRPKSLCNESAKVFGANTSHNTLGHRKQHEAAGAAIYEVHFVIRSLHLLRCNVC